MFFSGLILSQAKFLTNYIDHGNSPGSEMHTFSSRNKLRGGRAPTRAEMLC